MKKHICFNTEIWLILILVSFMGCTSQKRDLNDQTRKKILYSSTAKVKPSFIPLPPGAVTPKGWLKDWAEAAAKGITGHLDEYTATYGNAWKAYGFKARGALRDGTGWPLEQCSYWLDGAVRLAYILKDTALINKVTKRLDYVVNGVLNGGESFIYWKPRSILTDTANQNWPAFNNWAHSHMGRALVAYYQATQNENILKALVKVYQHYPATDLRFDFWDVTGAVNVDPMIETYLMSGDKTILDSLLSFSKRASYKSIIDKWSNGDFKPGHDVIYYEDIRIPALLYPWTGNRAELDATYKAIEWGEENYMLPVGLCSGEEYHAGIGATRNIETCNISASMSTFLWMLRITGEKIFSDRIEKIFFNAGPAPVARDFKSMCYYQSLNRYSNSLPGEEPQNPGAGCYKFTNIGHEVLCCVGNFNRVIPYYIMNMWMATMDGGVAATLYGPCAAEFSINDKTAVGIECQTSYPFNDSIYIEVTPEKAVEFPLYLRIPAWCGNPEISINGNTMDIPKKLNDFIKISRLWKKHDKITLYFPKSVSILKGRETPYPQISYFDKYHKLAKQTDVNCPFACVYYGPLLFSLAIPDKNPNQEMPGAKWNYALDVLCNNMEKDVKVSYKPLSGKWEWSLNAPIQISVKAMEFDWKPTENLPLPVDFIRKGQPATVTLAPYNCSKFRITMFPVTEPCWNSLTESLKNARK